MKLFNALVVGVVAVGVTVGAHQRRSSAGPHCHLVHGVLSSSFLGSGCTSPVGLCTEGQIQGGVLAGTTQYVAASIAPAATLPGEQGVFVSYAGTFTVTTSRGTATFQDKGVADDAPSGTFTQYEHLMGGTGVFADATGTVFINGAQKVDGSGFDAVVVGQLCGVDHDDDDDDGDG